MRSQCIQAFLLSPPPHDASSDGSVDVRVYCLQLQFVVAAAAAAAENGEHSVEG